MAHVSPIFINGILGAERKRNPQPVSAKVADLTTLTVVQPITS